MSKSLYIEEENEKMDKIKKVKVWNVETSGYKK